MTAINLRKHDVIVIVAAMVAVAGAVYGASTLARAVGNALYMMIYG